MTMVEDCDQAARVRELELDVERLEDEVKTAERKLRELRIEKAAEIACLQAELNDTASSLKTAEDDFRNYDELAGAVEALLDEVQRPVGSLNATLPVSARTSAALIALFDIINRNI